MCSISSVLGCGKSVSICIDLIIVSIDLFTLLQITNQEAIPIEASTQFQTLIIEFDKQTTLSSFMQTTFAYNTA